MKNLKDPPELDGKVVPRALLHPASRQAYVTHVDHLARKHGEAHKPVQRGREWLRRTHALVDKK